MDGNMCMSFAASEPQTGDGEEVVGGELGELQTAVRQAQVEGELNVDGETFCCCSPLRLELTAFHLLCSCHSE